MQVCWIREGVNLIMPVTPGSYTWTAGKQMETVRLSALGDVFLPGGTVPFSGSFEFLLPAQFYPWMVPGSRADPQHYLRQLNRWALEKEPVRFLITETEINTLCYIEEVSHREQDGTGDLYLTVSLREYRELTAPGTVSRGEGDAAAHGAGDMPSQGGERRYTIVRGDTLSVICRRFYGHSSAPWYNALARYNDIKNPHLIYPGRTLKIPPAAVLGVKG